jgi:hypothetical protein
LSGHDDLFDLFRRTAFRYEGLPGYDVPDEVERIRAWRENQPRPERSVRTSEWLRRIAVTTAQGKAWERVRAVDRPLPEYLRYELNGYLENQAAGDRTLLVDREQAYDGPDFWLFDTGTPHARAVIMAYNGGGRFVAAEEVTDQAVLAELGRESQRLLDAATPLNVWLAAEGAGVG